MGELGLKGLGERPDRSRIDPGLVKSQAFLLHPHTGEHLDVVPFQYVEHGGQQLHCRAPPLMVPGPEVLPYVRALDLMLDHVGQLFGLAQLRPVVLHLKEVPGEVLHLGARNGEPADDEYGWRMGRAGSSVCPFPASSM